MRYRMKITKTLETACALFPGLIRIMGLYYDRMVEDEVAAARIHEGDRVLCIGGGPVPYTALRIWKLTGAPVTVVDSDLKAVNTAARLIRGMEMEESITVLYSEGESVDATGYSVVHVALQVTPRERVLENIRKSLPEKARVLVRSPRHQVLHETLAMSKRWRARGVSLRGGALHGTLLIKTREEVAKHETVDSLTGRTAGPYRPAFVR